MKPLKKNLYKDSELGNINQGKNGCFLIILERKKWKILEKLFKN